MPRGLPGAPGGMGDFGIDRYIRLHFGLARKQVRPRANVESKSRRIHLK